jgi:hypothetical protein
MPPDAGDMTGLVAFAPPLPTPMLFGFQNPNNQLTPVGNGRAVGGASLQHCAKFATARSISIAV